VKVWFQNRRTKHKRVRSDDDEGNDDEEEIEEDEDDLESHHENENSSYIEISMQQQLISSTKNKTVDLIESSECNNDNIERNISIKRKHSDSYDETNQDLLGQAISNKNEKKIRSNYSERDSSSCDNTKRYFAVNSKFQNNVSRGLEQDKNSKLDIFENLLKKNEVQNYNNHHFKNSTPTF